jgi:RNA polymerase sigma-70 factor (ECF subfamily)
MEKPAERESLARRAASGDRGALERLWSEHRRFVAVVLLAHADRNADLQDLAQDVAAALCANIARLKDPARFRPWLRSIAVNAARESARRAARFGRPGKNGADPDALPAADAGDGGHDGATLDEVLRLARSLPEEYREPLLLKGLRGFSQKEIAAALDLEETTVETRLARARRMLRAALERTTGVKQREPTYGP